MKISFVTKFTALLALGILWLGGGPATAQLVLDPANFTAADVGNPARAGSSATVPGGFSVAGAGVDIGGTNDQFQFFYQAVIGDFDLAVRLDTLTFSDAWAKAGLMARESLIGGSRHYSTLATPAGSGSFFSFRAVTAVATTNLGSFPSTYPNMWLRLKRAGNSFSGYASVNGASWTQLGSYTPLSGFAGPLYVGLIAGSRSSNQLATAQFRELNNVVGTPPVGGLTELGREPLGPSTRRSAFVISEIMYHPRAVLPETNRSLEFIEIYNSQVYPENLGNHRLSGSIDFKFPANLLVGPGQFLVVARDPAYVQEHYGISGVLGPWNGAVTNNLPGGGGLVRLRNPAGAVLVEVPYQAQEPWPIAADGAGHSLVLNRPSYGERDAKAWSASANIDGSPGRDEPYGGAPFGGVVINEILAHTDAGAEDFIELYNHSNQPVDLSGAWLSDEANRFKFQIPEDQVLPAGGFMALSEALLGFSLSADGERVYLYSADRTRVLDAVKYEAQANGISSGRFPDGAPTFSMLSKPTPGSDNAGIKLPPIVINEIMYSPLTGKNNDEYLELYNRSAATQDLGGWRLRGGISFNFPSNMLVPPGGYLVVAENKTNLLAHYSNLNDANTVGNYDGALGNGGDRIALQQPVPNINYDTNTSAFVTNRLFVSVNELTYGDGGRWGNWSDGGGSSLELKDPNSDNRQAANWGDSDESAKAPWTSIEVTGNIGANQGPPDRLLIFDLGVGEFLLDDVEVRNSGAANLVRNSDFELGLTNWVLQGSHDQSTLENTGFSGTRSLHVRAASRGDNGANRVRTTAITGVAAVNVTLRAKVRWLRGWPEVLLRLNGGGLECSGTMKVPLQLGTPGARNSQAVDNAGPAIYEVTHSPALPLAQENVVVTARASDPGGVGALVLKYRFDTPIQSSFTSVTMVDDGTGPDVVAGDGIYSGLLPGRGTGQATSFYIEGTDVAGAMNTFPQGVFPPAGLTRCYPYDSMTRECVVRWGDRQMSGNIPTYHLWCTLTNIGRWDARDDLNNAPLDGTFVYNNYRVVYNARPQFAGSPWHQGAMSGGPTNNNSRVDYVCNFPEDDRFLGVTDTVLATTGNPEGNHGTDNTAQTEQTSYIVFREMGLQYNYRRWIHFFLNGNQRSASDFLNNTTGPIMPWVMEDSQQPNADMVEEWFPEDSDGELYKIEDWFEFTDAGTRGPNEDADLGRRENVINGRTVLNPAPYRFMWRKRAVEPGVSASDSQSIFEVINTVSPTVAYTELSNLPIPDPSGFDRLADVEQWMRIFAVQHAVGNWDSYGYERGKNAYAYKPKGGRFVQWTWDIDFTMGVGGNGATTSVFALGGDGDRRVEGMWNTPVFRRMYWRAFEDMMNGPWSNTYMDPILDAKASSLVANGLTYYAGNVTTIKSFIRDRRNYILGQLATANGRWNVAQPTNTLGTNLLVLSGTAPVAMRDIYLNGAYYPVTWTSVSNWTMRIVLNPGTNTFTLRGYKPDGTPATNDILNVTAVYEGTTPEPVGAVVFNEIMYNPSVADASFIEILNRSASAFDLTGWRIKGLNYQFPPGSILSPGQHMVLAKNPPAVLAAFPGASVFGKFSGNLDRDGETLTLLKPVGSGAPDAVIDKVRYENRLPWGTSANGFGNSLQLVDSSQDNSRPSNWQDREDWRFVKYTALVAANIDTNFFIWLTNAGSVYIDDIVLVTGAVANVGQNLLVNGDFESPLEENWTVIANHSNSVISAEIQHSGAHSLFVQANGAGGPVTGALRQLIEPFPTNTQCTISFWFLPTTNASLITLRCRNGSTFSSVTRVTPVLSTPGVANTVIASLPAYDPLWLNELQPENISGPTDNQGEREPWIELYNAGDTPLDLSGYYLANNYDQNLTQWRFPALSTIGPKEFKLIWADGQESQTAGNNLHTSFRLNSITGAVALVRLVNERPQITDYLTYANVGPGQSYGDFPDGQPFQRQVLYDATAGATNVARYVDIRINEWMAANTNNLADPADLPGTGFDDWFELYNAGTAPVDLGGFFLTDNPGNEDDLFEIPANGQYVIAPGEFFLVWADGSPEQNSPARRDLHVPFQLSRAGDTIALYAPDAETLIDRVQFGAQEDDVSEGRFPDGALHITTLAIATPCNANVIGTGNQAPTIAPIQDRTIRLGQSVSFTATATDPSVPAQTLTFQVVPVAPLGTHIDPNSGLFTWTPSPDQAPSTNEIKLRVTDNGTPKMSATRSVTIIVLLPPQSTITRTGPTEVTMSFDTIPGRTYQIQYQNRLGDPEWINLQPAEVAGGTTLLFTDDLTASPQRFYRILQVD